MHPKKYRKADFCVIGAGSGGLYFAEGAAQLGASVILVERGKMGGDYLNYGCVPSKALISAAKFGNEFERSKEFGWSYKSIDLNFSKVHDHVHKVIGSIAPHHSVERFEKLGVKVINREGHFIDPKTFETARHVIKAKRFVIATGSRPFIPPIEGIQDIPYLTNETLFNLKELPKHLVIIGGGSIGIEMAQAFQRLGSSVTVLEAQSFLPKDDPELTKQLLDILRSAGIVLHDHVIIQNIKQSKSGIKITYNNISQDNNQITASHVLVATGRRPGINELNLPAAGVKFTANGINVDQHLRTTNPRIYAIGDCIGGYQFTHVAAYHAGIVLRNSIFRLKTKVKTDSIPWVTYTDPELAHVGSPEFKLIEDKVPYKTLSYPYHENDRAQTDRVTQGKIKVHISPKGYVLGATILGAQAGELIFPWVIAIQNKIKISALASTVAPYPTLSEFNKAVAGSFYKERLFSSKVKKLVQFLMSLSR